MSNPGYDDEQVLPTAWEEYRQALTPEQWAAEDVALDAEDLHLDVHEDLT